VGIGHTRWATHGKPSDENAHPHCDCAGRLAVVHNGIIENYAKLKKELLSEGHHFTSQTDTEVIAHLIEAEFKGDLTEAVARALLRIEGSYAIGVISLANSVQMVAARKGSPLVLGCGKGENFIASDVPAVLPHTNKVIYLNDGEIALISKDEIEIFSFSPHLDSSSSLFASQPSSLSPDASSESHELQAASGKGLDSTPNASRLASNVPGSSVLSPQSSGLSPYAPLLTSIASSGTPDALRTRVCEIMWDASMAEKCGYKHFMLKEIYEQPRAIRDTFGRYITKEKAEIHFDEINLAPQELRAADKIYIIACGTSYHAALVGKLMLERYAKVSVEVDIASEFRYRCPLFPQNCLTIAISQSGETADTLAAIRQAKGNGSRVVSICNVVGSSVARESDGVIYTNAGPEIGVASTKAFTTQVVALYLFTLYFALQKGTINRERAKEMAEALYSIPERMEGILAKSGQIHSLAGLFYQKRDFLYLGRAYAYPIAMEGALKLKEISYIHAEGYPAGEMKHGPIALINEEMPVVALAPKSATYDKILSNIEEVKARGGIVIALATEGDDRIREKADHIFYIPEAPEELATLFMAIPLQLLAYHVADCRGCEIDQPRNLAKSVTVE
jgi:glucosamine--fructose-6-phosphate aminotransferase (isomerizing)